MKFYDYNFNAFSVNAAFYYFIQELLRKGDKIFYFFVKKSQIAMQSGQNTC